MNEEKYFKELEEIEELKGLEELEELKELKEIVIGGETYHRQSCVYAKTLSGCEPEWVEEEIYGGFVSSRVVYKSEAGTVLVVESVFGEPEEGHRSIENIVWVLTDDPTEIEDLVNKAKNRESAVIHIIGPFDEPWDTNRIIESENLRSVLEKNDPEEYCYYIREFVDDYRERTGNPIISTRIGEIIHIVE